MSSVEYMKIIEGLVRRLRDVDNDVVGAATHALGHILGHIGEESFNALTKKLSFAHQQVIIDIYAYIHHILVSLPI